jgi:hypothetical protein
MDYKLFSFLEVTAIAFVHYGITKKDEAYFKKEKRKKMKHVHYLTYLCIIM